MAAEELERFIVSYPDVVPSMNSPKSGYKGSHWSTGHKLKQEWEGILHALLVQSRMPRNVYEYMEVSAVLTFPRALRRDADNYRMMLSKALGDVLKGRWIPDDTPEYFRFTELTFDKGPRKKTTLTIDARRRTSSP